MVDIIYLADNDSWPGARHVALVIHQDPSGFERGYFYDSAKGDHGGSGPFDWIKGEALDRAERFAAPVGIGTVYVRNV